MNDQLEETEHVEEFDSAEGFASDSSNDYAARKRHIVLGLLAYSAVLGVIACFLPEENSPRDFFLSLPLLVLGIMWCLADAAERGHQIGRVMQISLVLVFIVALLIYLFQTRGLGAFKTIALAMVLAAAMLACLCAAAVATLTIGESTGLWEFAL